ncbi:MAG: nucleotidyltransferase domain-containing protein [Bacteroidales bacterium]|nr:nucleotidyltransferase domain-containing protein [Bacteroidales bacterium]
MKLKSEIKEEIAEKLSNNLNISNVILFGSYAHGKPNRSSDIDLLVILKGEHKTLSYSDRIRNRVQISKSLLNIIKSTPVDVLVHTEKEWKTLLESDSFFYQEIKDKGEYII